MSDNLRPPRPPRSLRGKLRERQEPDKSLEEAKAPDLVKPEYFDAQEEEFQSAEDAGNYLDQLEESLSDDDFTDEPIPDLDDEEIKLAPKVTKVDPPPKKVDIRQTREETRHKIQADVDRAKDEFEEIEEIVEDTKEGLSKIIDKVKEDTAEIRARLTAVSLKIAEKTLAVTKDLLFGIFFKKKSKSAPAEKKEAEPEQKIKKIPKVKYAELLKENIQFLAYDKRPLANPSDTGIVLEEIFMTNAIADARYCIKYVVDLPVSEKGPYANRPVVEIFESITAEDINFFLYYVKKHPELFKNRSYKFSEAMATWIIRKSHET